MVGCLGSGGSNAIPRPLVEDFPSLNIHQLARAGGLVSGAITAWQWQRNGPGVAATARGEIGRIVLEVDGVKTVVQVAQVETARTRFPLFVCPRCSSRRWDIYIAAHVGCRGCLHLDYASRHTCWRGRTALARAARLRRRLSDGRPIITERLHRMLGVLARCDTKAQVAIALTLATVERHTGA